MKGGKSKSQARNAALSVNKKAGGASKPKKPSKKAAKDPNMPKRPPSAFFVFMEEFRQTYKEKHPNNKSVSVVGKAGGDKWKSMSDAEKAPYVAKAERRKADYEKSMKAYNKRQAEGPKPDEDDAEANVEDEVDDEEASDEDEDDD